MSFIIRNRGIISGGQFYGSYTTYSLTANTNDLSIPSIQNYVLIELSSTGNYKLTGLVPYTTADAWIVKIFNIGTKNIIFKNNDVGSLANNRFLIGGDKTIQAGEGIELVYRPSVLRWGSTGINI